MSPNTSKVALRQHTSKAPPKMADVVFYTVLGKAALQEAPTPPPATSAFALNSAGTYTCKRLGPLPTSPTLLVLVFAGRT